MTSLWKFGTQKQLSSIDGLIRRLSHGDDKVNLQCYVWLASSKDWQVDLCQMDSHYLLRRAPPAPLLKVQILFLKGALIKSGETYFGRNLVFPGQIGSLFRAGCCQPSWVKRKVKGPLLKAISGHQQSVTFGSKCWFGSKMVLHFFWPSKYWTLQVAFWPLVCVGSMVIGQQWWVFVVIDDKMLGI